MDEMNNNISSFKAINEDIKAMLRDLEDRVSEHACIDPQKVSENNKVFLEILDKLLEARCTIEELKKYHF